MQNRYEITTTKKNTFFNITKINNSTSTKDINEEKKILNQKRKEKKINDKGHRKDTMTIDLKLIFLLICKNLFQKLWLILNFAK